MMEINTSFKCEKCADKYACPDTLIDVHNDGGYGIIVHDGGSSHIRISYCPWCGIKLNSKTS
ncbi:MAG: hypothetical protein HQK54_10870 [Oligoflexales bacterium]|nr:hypothetical protein [Oligoflexales bacterium]